MTAIQRVRTAKRVTRGDLAEAADISYRTLWNIETRGAEPTEKTLFAIADALGVEPGELTEPQPVAKDAA